MQGYNLIVVYNNKEDKILMCRRKKNPYMGMSNFVGGKIESQEASSDAAYRELHEETSISKDDITLTHFMDMKYYLENCYVEVFVGKLNKEVTLVGDENELYWSSLNNNFFDLNMYAGSGNIGHILELVNFHRTDLLV